MSARNISQSIRWSIGNLLCKAKMILAYTRWDCDNCTLHKITLMSKTTQKSKKNLVNGRPILLNANYKESNP